MSTYERRGNFIVPAANRAVPRDGTRNGVTYMTSNGGNRVVMRVGSDLSRAIAAQTPEPDPTGDLLRELQAQRQPPSK